MTNNFESEKFFFKMNNIDFLQLFFIFFEKRDFQDRLPPTIIGLIKYYIFLLALDESVSRYINYVFFPSTYNNLCKRMCIRKDFLKTYICRDCWFSEIPCIHSIHGFSILVPFLQFCAKYYNVQTSIYFEEDGMFHLMCDCIEIGRISIFENNKLISAHMMIQNTCKEMNKIKYLTEY
jgi:hypothetical protein